ncbi:hypothetical protein GN956_G10284 [Arapaima gigas]
MAVFTDAHVGVSLCSPQTERESFLAEHSPGSGRLVCISLSSDDLSTGDQVRLLHSALRKCLALLQGVMRREEELGGPGGEYESVRNSVRDRLEHLLHSTKLLMAETRPQVHSHPLNSPQVAGEDESSEPDEFDGTFQVKVWTYQVLQELVHWTHCASQTLHVLHTQGEGEGTIEYKK